MEMMADRKKLKIRLGLVTLLIYFLNTVAIKFYWYSSISWFDMPMHFLGGFWLGLGAIYLLLPKQDYRSSIIKTILIVLFFALAWEGFEFFVDANFSKKVFDIYDTLSDICFGLAGGFSAIFYFFKRIGVNTENKV